MGFAVFEVPTSAQTLIKTKKINECVRGFTGLEMSRSATMPEEKNLELSNRVPDDAGNKNWDAGRKNWSILCPDWQYSQFFLDLLLYLPALCEIAAGWPAGRRHGGPVGRCKKKIAMPAVFF